MFLYTLAHELHCFKSDLDRMGFTELMGWSAFFKQRAEQAEQEKSDLGTPAGVAQAFNL